MSETTQVLAYGFQSGAYDTQRNKITTLHVAGDGQVAEFDVASRTWQLTQGTGERPGTGAHNCSLAYDPVNDRMWLGACGPQPVPGAYFWSAADKGFTRYDSTVAPPCSVDAVMAYDPQGQAIYCLGGYNNPSQRVHRLLVASGASGAAAWHLVREGGGPSLTSEAARLTYTRGGWDPTARNIWVIDDSGNLWRFDPATFSWSQQVTAGVRPPGETVFGLDDGARTIIGWAGMSADQTVLIRQTWLLNLSTLTWTQGPSEDFGTPTPSTPYATSAYTLGPGGRACFLISTAIMRVWCFVVPAGGTTPPAPTEVTLTVSTAGTGSGSVTGGGTYLSGTQVTLAAAPASGSTFTGWTGDSDCIDGVVTADRSKTCVANFAPSAPPNPAGYVPTPFPASMPVGEFVPIPCDPRFDNSPWPCGGESKHQRWVADGQGSIWTGFGDTSPSRHAGNPSQNQGYRLNVATGEWTRWNPACRPPGQIMPGFPDEVIWAYDQRGYFWLLGGVTQGIDGALCNSGAGESGATMYRTGLFRYDPATDRWERFTGVASTNALWGHFDNRNKHLLYMGQSSSICGASLHRLNVDTLQLTSTPACFSTRPFPGDGGGNFEDFADVRVHASAWDEAGRTLYVMGYHNVKVASETSGFPVLHLWAINVDTGQITLMPDPPIDATRFRTPDAQDIVFDTHRRRVVFPHTPTHCGVVEAMITFDVTSRTWTSYPLNPSSPVPGGVVRANTAVYDPFHDVVVMGGSVFCGDLGYPGLPKITNYFYWR